MSQQFTWTASSPSGSNPLTLTMNSAMTETANFTATATQNQLTTSVSPSGAGGVSPASGSYNAGAMTITATANSGYAFSNFTGTYSGATNPLSINLSGTGTITANFVPGLPGYTISGQVTLSGNGSGVSGVSISASGSQSGSTITDANGSYSLPGLAGGGSYTVTASKSGYALSAAQSFANLAANQTASFTATPPLSINGGSNSAEVAPSTNVSMAFNLYDQAGANDIGWAQFYLADNSGNASCMGDWGRPNGLDLYDGNTGVTYGFGINQRDTFCTVSLTSIANSVSDPTQVTVVLSFNFNPGPGGTYTVLTQINYGSGIAGSWQALGTLIIDSARAPVTSPPVYQPPPESEPVPTAPPPVSASTTNCGDISGNWTDTNNSAWTYSIDTSGGALMSDSSAAYTNACGTITWQLTGSRQPDGTWQIAFSNGSTNSCGQYGQSGTANVAPACNAATVTGSFSGGTGTQSQTIRAMALASSSGTTTWQGTSPGISLSVDPMAGKITTQLTGHKTSTLTVAVNNSQGQEMLSTPHGLAQAGNSFSDSFRTLIQSGQQYGSVIATWDTASLTVPVSFFTIGITHFTQYNTPYHSSCSDNPQPALIINKIDAQYCYYQDVILGPAFATAVFTNGTGVWDVNGTNTVLKSYDAGAKATPTKIGCPLYQGFDNHNTFFSVDAGGNPITKINGSHWSVVLSDGTGPGTGSILNNNNPPPGSLATDPTATNAGSPPIYLWSDAVLLFDQNDRNDSRGLRSVQDLCPACTGQATEQSLSAPAHIDMYNGTSKSCIAHSVGDYGQYYAIRLR